MQPEREETFEAFYKRIMGIIRSDPARCVEEVASYRAANWEHLDPTERALHERLTANSLREHGEISRSLKQYEKAWKLFGKLGNSFEQARTAVGWVDALAIAGNLDRAQELTVKARRLLRPEHALIRAKLDANLANALSYSGRNSEATKTYRRVLRIASELGDEDQFAIASHNLGNVYLWQGQLTKAKDHFQDALRIYRSQGAIAHAIRCETQFLTTELAEGNWSYPVQRLREIEFECEQVGDRRGVIRARQELIRFMTALGASEIAEPVAARLFSFVHSSGYGIAAAHAATLHGRLLSQLGRFHDASLRFEEGSALYRASGNLEAARKVDLEIARALLHRGRSEESFTHLRGAGRYLESAMPSGAGAISRGLKARIYLDRGHWGRAVNAGRRAHATARDREARPERPRMALTVAQALSNRGDHQLAMRWVSKASNELVDVTNRLGSRDLIGAWAGFRSQLHRRVVDVALASGGKGAPRKALNLLVELRALNEDDLLRRSASAKDNELRIAVTKLRDSLLDESATRNRAAIQRKLEVLEQRLLQSASTGRIGETEDDVRAWSALLGSRQLVVYDCSGGHWRAFVVSPSGAVRHVELPQARAAVRQHWVSLRLLLETASRSRSESRRVLLDRTRDEAYLALKELAGAIWKPLELENRETVLVPDGALQGLPIEALTWVTDEDPRICSRLPHPYALRRPPRGRGRRVMLLSGEGEGMAAEARFVSRRLRGSGYEVARGNRRSDLDKANGRLSALHVAAHGQFYRKDWLLSGIKLRDGWFGFEQLRPAQLRGALVYLSSCESGMAGEAPGAEMSGWLSAGVSIGAAEMVLSLWKIDEESSSTFAREFYDVWTKGQPASEAAHVARKHSLQNLPHPYHWAPFIAMG